MRPRGVTTLEFADFISSFFVTAAGIMGENLHFSFAGNAVYLRTGQLRSRFFVAIFNRRGEARNEKNSFRMYVRQNAFRKRVIPPPLPSPRAFPSDFASLSAAAPGRFVI